MSDGGTETLFAGLQSEIHDLVLSYLCAPAGAMRPAVPYQTVRLGEQDVAGALPWQRSIFAGIDLRAKSVLVLGCNLGEVAREAAAAGASSVLGVDRNRFLVQLARLITTYNQLNNVTFAQADLGNRDFYTRSYDVVVALDIFAGLDRLLDEIAAMTKDFMIVAGPRPDSRISKNHLASLQRHFPHVSFPDGSDTTAPRELFICSRKPIVESFAPRANDNETVAAEPAVPQRAPSGNNWARALRGFFKRKIAQGWSGQPRGSDHLFDGLQARIRDLVSSYLRAPAISLSSYEGKRTGNAYQTVRMKELLVPGFRAGNRDVFAGIVVRDKTVLDLGCNLGEIARDAARAGATAVVGVEYDPFFVQIARLVTAYNEMSNISIAQADLTKPEFYTGSYDIVVALAVFSYTKNFQAELAAMTKELMIVETHLATPEWMKRYLAPLKRHFPYVAMIGIVSHHQSASTDARYLLVCGRNPIDGILTVRARELVDRDDLPTIDMSRSRVRHLNRVLDAIGADRSQSFAEIAALAQAHLGGKTTEEIVKDIDDAGLTRSPLYWCSFLVGYLEYKQRGSLDRTNCYIRTLTELAKLSNHSREVQQLIDGPDQAYPRLTHRFRTFAHLVEGQDEGTDIDPVIIFNLIRKDRFRKGKIFYELYLNEIGEAVYPLSLDGHHRIFIGYLTKAKKLRCIPMWHDRLRAATIFLERNSFESDVIWEDVHRFTESLLQANASKQTPAQGAADLQAG